MPIVDNDNENNIDVEEADDPPNPPFVTPTSASFDRPPEPRGRPPAATPTEPPPAATAIGVV